MKISRRKKIAITPNSNRDKHLTCGCFPPSVSRETLLRPQRTDNRQQSTRMASTTYTYEYIPWPVFQGCKYLLRGSFLFFNIYTQIYTIVLTSKRSVQLRILFRKIKCMFSFRNVRGNLPGPWKGGGWPCPAVCAPGYLDDCPGCRRTGHGFPQPTFWSALQGLVLTVRWLLPTASTYLFNPPFLGFSSQLLTSPQFPRTKNYHQKKHFLFRFHQY